MATAITENAAAMKGSERYYRPELDVLRFIAFSLVFIAHTTWPHPWARAGILGVPVFFLLSAFLITDLLLQEKAKTKTIHIKSFYIRRILRIWPLYFAALLLGFVVVNYFTRRYSMSGTDLAWYLLLGGNWRAATHGYLPLGLNLLWTISVEEQFYLVWPTLVRWFSRKTILCIAISMWLVSQVATIVLCAWKIPFEPGIWCNTFISLQYFAIGAAFSILLNDKLPTISTMSRIAMAALGIAIFMFCGPLLLGNHPPLIRYILPGLGLAGIGASLLFMSLLGASLPKLARPVTYMGRVSYGLYVMHVWVWSAVGFGVLYLTQSINGRIFLRYVLTIILTFTCAILSYKFFEKPFLKLKSRFEFVKSRSA